MKKYYVIKSNLKTGSQEVLNEEYFLTEGEAATLMVNTIICTKPNKDITYDIAETECEV